MHTGLGNLGMIAAERGDKKTCGREYQCRSIKDFGGIQKKYSPISVLLRI